MQVYKCILDTFGYSKYFRSGQIQIWFSRQKHFKVVQIFYQFWFGLGTTFPFRIWFSSSNLDFCRVLTPLCQKPILKSECSLCQINGDGKQAVPSCHVLDNSGIVFKRITAGQARQSLNHHRRSSNRNLQSSNRNLQSSNRHRRFIFSGKVTRITFFSLSFFQVNKKLRRKKYGSL